MDLKRCFERFADHELLRWDSATASYLSTGVVGALQVYDRFVSDRDFGQKKRIFLCPAGFSVDQDLAHFKIGGVPGVWLIEGSNPDADATGVYGSAVVLREARYKVQLLKEVGTRKRANGVGYTNGTLEVQMETFGDFSRYSSSESREMENIDYTIGTWFLPRGTPVDLDTIIRNSYNQNFQVREVTSFLDLLMVRTQEREDLTP